MTRSLLGRRLIAATRLARWEARVGGAIDRALARHEDLASKALRASVHPDPFHLDLWDDTVEEEVAPIIADVLGDVTAGTLAFLALPEATKSLVLGRIDVDYEAVSFVARIKGMGPGIADDLRRSLNAGSALGEGIPELSARVGSVFGVGERRGETIARTEMNGAANRTSNATAGALHESGVPLLKTWVATADDRTRDAHIDADGQQVPYDEPFDVDGEDMDYPGDPSGSAENTINCVPGWSRVGAQAATGAYRRVYDGEMVTVETETGRVLAATPNHPALTASGWVPLGEINEGEDLVSYVVSEPVNGGDPHEEDGHPRVEEVFRAALVAGHIRREVGGRPDFHGDGSDTEVEVVRLEWPLRFDRQAALLQENPEAVLVTPDGAHLALGCGPGPGAYALGSIALAASCRVGGGEEGGPAVRPGPFEADGHRGGASPQVDARLLESPAETTPIEAEIDGKGFQGLAARVAFDRVVKIKRGSYVGHVYNLQTEGGWYSIDGLVVSNCRCAVIYDEDVPEDAQEEGDAA